MSLRFRLVQTYDLLTIMNWRMLPEITQFMCSDPKLTLNDQKVWFDKINKESDSFYWVFDVDEKPAGLISLVEWDKENNTIHSGSYIAEHWARSLHNIIDLHMNQFRFAMEELHVNRIAMEIMSNNIGQLQWITRFGAKKEGILRQAIQKNGIHYDLHLFSILASEWPEIKRKTHFNMIDIETKING